MAALLNLRHCRICWPSTPTSPAYVATAVAVVFFLNRLVFPLVFLVSAYWCQNDSFSQTQALALLTPTQLAQLTLSPAASVDRQQIDRVFEQLEQDDALENVDEFLAELSANGTVECSDNGERMTALVLP